MNHRGILDPQTDGRPAGRRRENAQPTEGAQSFNAFGAPGDSRARRRPLNTAAASAAADAHRTAADDFWSTNQGWADSQADNWSGADRQQQDNWQQDNWQQGGWQQHEKPAWHSDPNWNTHQGWADAQPWSDTPAQTWHDAGPAPEPSGPARHDRPTTIAEALENAPVAEEDIDEEPRQSRSRGAHRVAAPPSALKGRAAVVAVAAGAVVAAGQCATAEPGDHKQAQQATDYEAAGSVHEIAAQSMAIQDPAVSTNTASPQMLGGNLPADTGRFGEMLANGAQFAEDLAQAEEAKFRPLFSKFASGSYTSGYGARWGVQHLGIDVAAPIGTPIYAVADGEVIDAGPASGFGMWVRLMHADGTVTVYGHVDTTTVSMGEYVFAGDQIATVGNRGFSTGPHCHFEVWLNGSDKIDPVPWLATRGIGLTGSGD
ncbi:M23 family metallopeptidase [Nocardia sp. NBC_01329]|uniref:M23 family metallopeptidase n=1 Tax=Nocardia sp. NBC_01329 TaxID=2903594 RepID=UPI002E15F0D9|nr:M23 family metallopeptidase [Nocardia sp. NBC_01329]